MRYDENFAYFAPHFDWYEFDDDIGYVPTDKAPKEAVIAMEKYNSYTFNKEQTSNQTKSIVSLIESAAIKETLNMPLYERVKLLQKGDKVLCKKCKEGVMNPKGDFKRTNTFVCNKCDNQIIID